MLALADSSRIANEGGSDLDSSSVVAVVFAAIFVAANGWKGGGSAAVAMVVVLVSSWTAINGCGGVAATPAAAAIGCWVGEATIDDGSAAADDDGDDAASISAPAPLRAQNLFVRQCGCVLVCLLGGSGCVLMRVFLLVSVVSCVCKL